MERRRSCSRTSSSRSAHRSTSRRIPRPPTPTDPPTFGFRAPTAATSPPKPPALNWARCFTCAIRFCLLLSATPTRPGDLNTMAKQFADRVNQLLTSGNITDGPPAQAGVPLFTYDTTDATATAASLSVDPSVTPDQLAAISPGPPAVSNGVPLALSALGQPRSRTPTKSTASAYSQFYGQLAGRVGTRPERRHQQPGRAAIAALPGQGSAPAVSGSIAR